MSGDVQFEGTPEEWKALVEKSIQKKLLTEIMDADAKDGLYSAVSKMETTQTAVEWLWEQIPELLPFTVDTETAIGLLMAYEKAKAMEKEQITNAFENARQIQSSDEYSKTYDWIDAEQYYKETYNP